MTTKQTLPKKFFHFARKGGKPDLVSPQQFAKRIAAKNRAKDAQVKAMVPLAVRGEEFEPDPDLDPKMLAYYKKLFGAVKAAVEAHFEEEDRVDEERAAAERAEAEKREEQLKRERELALKGQLALSEGKERSVAIVEGFVGGLQSMLGDDFEVSPRSLLMSDELTDEGVLEAIAKVMSAQQSGNIITDGLKFVEGDLLVEAEKRGTLDAQIDQLVDERGQSKHTFREALKVAKRFSPAEREKYPNVKHSSFTDAANYGEKIPKKKLHSILSAANKGDKTTTVDLATGRNLVEHIPWSTRKLRLALQVAAGLRDEDGNKLDKDGKVVSKNVTQTAEGTVTVEERQSAPKDRAEKDEFLYIDCMGSVFRSSPDFDAGAAEEAICIVDLTSMTTVNATGDEIASIPNLDEASGVWPATFPEESEEAEEDGIPA